MFYFYRFLILLGGEGGCLDWFFIRLLTRDPSSCGIFYAEVGGSGYLLPLSPPIQIFWKIVQSSPQIFQTGWPVFPNRILPFDTSGPSGPYFNVESGTLELSKCW